MRTHGFAALAALSLIAAPVAAATAPLAPLPAARAGDSTQGSSELTGTTAWILAAVALGLIVWGVIELTSDDDDFPTSP